MPILGFITKEVEELAQLGVHIFYGQQIDAQCFAYLELSVFLTQG